MSSDYQTAMNNAVRVLARGEQQLHTADAVLTDPAEQRLPVYVTAALVAACDQLAAALRQLRARLINEATTRTPPPPATGSTPQIGPRLAAGSGH